MSSRILTGDVFDMLPTIALGSVDCCVTSPPYWMLRSYLPKDHPLKPRELGSEKTPGEFVARMVEVFRLVRDCMADHATCWLNVGDSYASGEQGRHDLMAGQIRERPKGLKQREIVRTQTGIDSGNLCLIPQRLAIALQDDGWIVRSIVIWHKPACMPASLAGWRWMRCRVKESGQKKHPTRKNAEEVNHARVGLARFTNGVEDKSLATQWSDCPGCDKCRPNDGYVLRRGSWRPTSSYEPILMLAKKPGYYADGEAVKTKAKRYWNPETNGPVGRNGMTEEEGGQGPRAGTGHPEAGANLRDVWTIAAEPLAEKHYAAFPTELVRLCLKAGTSEKGYCRECGKPWARVVEPPSGGTTGKGWTDHLDDEEVGRRGGNMGEANAAAAGWETYQPAVTIGWRPTCQHDTEPRPALVLDPFAGSGRTGVTAQRMFLDFIGCELNPDYAAMSERILRDDCPLFSA